MVPGSDQTQPRDLRSTARSDDASNPVSSLPSYSDRLRQVLHLLHRANDVRGPEQGRPPGADHCRSTQVLADQGCREKLRLLGQTVNSYQFRTVQARQPDWPDLLGPACTMIDGIERLKFVTNYPKDMTDDLLDGCSGAIRRSRPTCTCPLQSGSNDVLRTHETRLHR